MHVCVHVYVHMFVCVCVCACSVHISRSRCLSHAVLGACYGGIRAIHCFFLKMLWSAEALV